jgi:hypothetical protein
MPRALDGVILRLQDGLADAVAYLIDTVLSCIPQTSVGLRTPRRTPVSGALSSTNVDSNAPKTAVLHLHAVAVDQSGRFASSAIRELPCCHARTANACRNWSMTGNRNGGGGTVAGPTPGRPA